MRLTSPKLNYVIILGSLLMYLSIIFQLVPTTSGMVTEAMCVVSINLIAFNCSRHTLYAVGTLALYDRILPCIWSSLSKNVEGLSHISQSKTKEKGEINY